MMAGKGSVQAGSTFLCCLILWAVTQGMAGENEMQSQPVLCQNGVYAIYEGVKGDTYPWSFREKWQDTGYLARADGMQPAKSEEACLSMRETAGGYVPLDGDVLLRPDALYALCAMQNDYPLEEGVQFFRGYLTEEEQNAWRADAVIRRSKALPAGKACPVPEGGKSEHQLGLAADVKLTGKLNMKEKDPLRRNATGLWLAENMWRYGYVYDADYDGCEAIHLRYVGKGHARMMHLLDMNMAEYLDFLQKHKAVTLMHGETMIASVQCVTEGDENVQLPQGMRWDMSRDNQGNIILYCWAE